MKYTDFSLVDFPENILETDSAYKTTSEVEEEDIIIATNDSDYNSTFDSQGNYFDESIESWTNTESLWCKINQIKNNSVYLDCLLDREARRFQLRKFPKSLFGHLRCSEGNPVILSIKSRNGAMRIDIYKGDGIVDLEYFNAEDKWEELREANLDRPFTL